MEIGTKNATFIASRQTVAPPIEAKFLEQENVGRGEHAHAGNVFSNQSAEFLHSIKKKGRKGRSCPGFRNLPGGQKFKALVPIIRGSDHRNLLASNENLPQSAP